jgi:MFS family permease
MKASRGALHYAWVVLGHLRLGSGLALRGAAISLLLLGAAGPVVGWLADRWGPRRVILLSAIILSARTMLSSRVTALWQVYITSEVLMGLGAGGVGMSTGAALAARWFEARRGLVMGWSAGRCRRGSSWWCRSRCGSLSTTVGASRSSGWAS